MTDRYRLDINDLFSEVIKFCFPLNISTGFKSILRTSLSFWCHTSEYLAMTMTWNCWKTPLF
jgi:hypothetical protein